MRMDWRTFLLSPPIISHIWTRHQQGASLDRWMDGWMDGWMVDLFHHPVSHFQAYHQLCATSIYFKPLGEGVA